MDIQKIQNLDKRHFPQRPLEKNCLTLNLENPKKYPNDQIVSIYKNPRIKNMNALFFPLKTKEDINKIQKTNGYLINNFQTCRNYPQFTSKKTISPDHFPYPSLQLFSNKKITKSQSSALITEIGFTQNTTKPSEFKNSIASICKLQKEKIAEKRKINELSNSLWKIPQKTKKLNSILNSSGILKTNSLLKNSFLNNGVLQNSKSASLPNKAFKSTRIIESKITEKSQNAKKSNKAISLRDSTTKTALVQQSNPTSIKTAKLLLKSVLNQLKTTNTLNLKTKLLQHKINSHTLSTGPLLSPTSLQVSIKSKQYYLNDLNESFRNETGNYFNDLFRSHFCKSLSALESMKDLNDSRYKLRMTPISLDSMQGITRPSLAQNINIYLNYQLTARVTHCEPNFYKMSYEKLLAKKKLSCSFLLKREKNEEEKHEKSGGTSIGPAILRKDQVSKQSISSEKEGTSGPRRKTIFFDLDETLIHSCKGGIEKGEFSIIVKMPNKSEKLVWFNVRPFLTDLLNSLKDDFELVIFTASHYCYANPIIDEIDPQKLFKTRLFRDHCDLVDNGIFVKNLAIFKDRDLRDLIIVDNSLSSFAAQISNGVPIIPFIDNKWDDQFSKLKWFLLSLKTCEDVRVEIQNHFDWQKLREKYEPENFN